MTAEIAAAWAALEGKVTEGTPNHTLAEGSPPSPGVKVYRHYRPLVEAVTTFVREAQDTNRVFTGIEPFDREMRGVGRGHLLKIDGYNHSGKTLVLLHMLRYNHNKRIALFSPDETASLILAKLASIQSGVPAVELERRVGEGDQTAIQLLREIALNDFPNLIVFDKPLIPGDMEAAYREAEDVWGEACDMCVIDFLDLVQAGETVEQKIEFVKAFGTRNEVPMVLLHQTSRSAGAQGRRIGIDSGKGGGEAYATFQVGVRRKKNAIMAEMDELAEQIERKGSEAARERYESLAYDLGIHQYTLSVNLNKNKRPGGNLVDEIDFELIGETGQLIPLDGNLPRQYLATRKGQPDPIVRDTWQQVSAYDDEW